MDEPIYCVKCKKQLDASWTHCPNCGATQQFSAKQQEQVVAPSATTPNLPPTAFPVYTPQQPPAASLVLDEMARQYRNLTWLQFVGIFLVGAYFIGLAMIIYAMIQKPAFRRRVAEMGYDPEAWEAPLRAHATKVLLTGIVIFLIVGLISVAVIFLPNAASTQPTPTP